MSYNTLSTTNSEPIARPSSLQQSLCQYTKTTINICSSDSHNWDVAPRFGARCRFELRLAKLEQSLACCKEPLGAVGKSMVCVSCDGGLDAVVGCIELALLHYFYNKRRSTNSPAPVDLHLQYVTFVNEMMTDS